ncbi:hypothetical protein AJ80_06779 [Polytolypa hystricis UAMH7299]|uniref:Uncharacterized protein n=1 Tax=Polytolypa hystricis (strain UAMH7299) TaxID=1447883 RepID=A0A2B7XTJ4_POLH7|nr:hypothetical protein AJ80_06779 [Polytolypa hystricis UAMH7299]
MSINANLNQQSELDSSLPIISPITGTDSTKLDIIAVTGDSSPTDPLKHFQDGDKFYWLETLHEEITQARIFHIFREAIVNAAEKQTQFFRNFRGTVDREPILTDTQKKEELRLVLEISDILDELNTLKRVLGQHQDVIIKAMPRFPKAGGRLLFAGGQEDSESTIHNDRTVHSMNKQTTIALNQVDAISAQSQILILFTIVTVVFTPLSFFTSYFGMNITELTGEDQNIRLSEAWKVMGPAYGAIIFTCLAASLVMYVYSKYKLHACQVRETLPATGSNTQCFGFSQDSLLSAKAPSSPTRIGSFLKPRGDATKIM